jgi:hypothetical protein
MRLEFCHWLHTNHQLLPLILFTDAATFTRNAINTRNSQRWSHDNPYGIVETNFQRNFSINVCCGMIGRGSTINWTPRSPDLTPLGSVYWVA